MGLGGCDMHAGWVISVEMASCPLSMTNGVRITV